MAMKKKNDKNLCKRTKRKKALKEKFIKKNLLQAVNHVLERIAMRRA
jgi:hypothetical protein